MLPVDLPAGDVERDDQLPPVATRGNWVSPELVPATTGGVIR